MNWLVGTGIALLSFVAAAQGGEMLLFTGSGTLESNGWRVESAAGDGVGVPGGTVTVIPHAPQGESPPVLEVKTTGSQVQQYSIPTGYSEALVSARIKVLEAQKNRYDAGLVFSLFGDDGSGRLPDRFNSFYIVPDEVGFMDLGASAPITPGLFHDYAILYSKNKVSLFVDQPFAEILAGKAKPLLERTGPFLQPDYRSTLGNVYLGDQTNDVDPPVNSHYLLESIRFHGITPVKLPAPGTSAKLCVNHGTSC
jgi:hypothetical protein